MTRAERNMSSYSYLPLLQPLLLRALPPDYCAYPSNAVNAAWPKTKYALGQKLTVRDNVVTSLPISIIYFAASWV